MRAERGAGEFLRDQPKAEGAKGSGSNQYQVRSEATTAAPTYTEQGIDKRDASTWQRIAEAPEITTAWALRLTLSPPAGQVKKAGVVDSPPEEDCIYSKN